MSSIASRDENRVTVLMGINNVTGLPQEVLVDADGRLLVSAIVSGAGITGPVTSVVGALALWGDTTGDSLTDSAVKLITGVLSPVTSDTVALGSGTLMWSDLFLASGSVINWNNGDLTLTHSANTLTLAGGDLNLGANALVVHKITCDASDGTLIEAANGTDVAIFGVGNTANATFYGAASFTGAVLPTVDNTPALGASSQAWADLFLGDGAVINFNLGDVTLTHSANTLTLGGGDLALGVNNLTLTGSIGATGARSTKGWFTNLEVTNAPTVGGSVVYYSGGTDVSVADGGTGLSTLTANNVILGNGASAVQFVAPGASGNVLTSNGTTWTSATPAASSTARRNLNILLNTSHLSLTGTSPTNSSTMNGIQCSVSTNDATSAASVTVGTEANWDFYDKDPEFNVNIQYSAGSATGTGTVYCGDTTDSFTPTSTQTTKCMFILGNTVAGTTTWYAVNASGTTNTNTSLTGITSTQENLWRVVKNSTTNIKWYTNYTLKATHTTNLPSGDTAAATIVICGVDNGGGDSTTRTAKFGFLDVLLNSPTG